MNRSIIAILSGTVLLSFPVVVSVGTAAGLFGTQYYLARVTRIIPEAERKPWCPLAWVVVNAPEDRDIQVIVMRGDRRQYKVGDRVVVCQPFGPPYIVPGAIGRLVWLARLMRLPMVLLGVFVFFTGILTFSGQRVRPAQAPKEPPALP